jgi:hypothetical protein
MNDYTTNLKRASEYPKFYLGQEVKTPNGLGIIINLSMPSNGLYICPERSTAVVWYGVDPFKTPMVQEEYSLKDLDSYNKEVNDGQ